MEQKRRTCVWKYSSRSFTKNYTQPLSPSLNYLGFTLWKQNQVQQGQECCWLHIFRIDFIDSKRRQPRRVDAMKGVGWGFRQEILELVNFFSSSASKFGAFAFAFASSFWEFFSSASSSPSNYWASACAFTLLEFYHFRSLFHHRF